MHTKRAFLRLVVLPLGLLHLLPAAQPLARAQTVPSITRQPASQTNLPGTSATLTVAVSGSGPFNYRWLFNGTLFPNRIITTVAGAGSTNFSGDGGPAAGAGLDLPSAVTVDADGNLFIADQLHQRVRKVDSNGFITTLAGNGASGFSGDGGPATNAMLNSPSGVAVSASGDVFIADTGNLRVRRVDRAGLITTFAGGGLGAAGGPATNTGLRIPSAVALDAAGELFIADRGMGRIWKVDTNGIITSVAGNGVAGSSGDGGAATLARLIIPSGVAVDAFGNLLIADSFANRIRRVDTNGIITTVAGDGLPGFSGDGGAATNARLNSPHGVAADAFGNFYIADTTNQCIRIAGPDGIISTVAGTSLTGYAGDGGIATDANLSSPTGLAVDAGNLFIADELNGRVRRLATGGSPSLTLSNLSALQSGEYQVIVATASGSVTSAVAVLNVLAPPVITAQPAAVGAAPGSTVTLVVEAAGALPLSFFWYFNGASFLATGTNSTLVLTNVSQADAGNYSVVVTNQLGSATGGVMVLQLSPLLTSDGEPTNQTVSAGGSATFTVTPTGSGPFSFQWQFNGADLPNDLITTVAGVGPWGWFGDGGPATSASLYGPAGVAVDAAGDVFIADYYNNRVREVGFNGVITTVAGNGSQGYSGDGGPATNASLNFPSSVAVDAGGNLYIADYGNYRIRKVDTNGVITTFAGTGESSFFGYAGDGGPATRATFGVSLLNWATVAVDSSGNLFIGDNGANVVRRVSTNGIITTVAGNGSQGYSGDGGPATDATFSTLLGICVDTKGNLFIADGGNSRVRQVDTSGIITTVAGTGGGDSGDGGPATDAGVSRPISVAADGFGNLYISELLTDRLRMVDPNGIISTVARGVSLDFPTDLACDGLGDVYISDMGDNLVLEMDPEGSFYTVAGDGIKGFFGDGGPATQAGLFAPTGVVADAMGDIYIADSRNDRVREVDANNIITTVAGNGPAQFPTTGFLGNFGGGGGFSGDRGPATFADLSNPDGLALDPVGDLFIADEYNRRIRKVDTLGTITTVAGSGSSNLVGDGGPATQAGFSSPSGVAFDASGNLFIADSGNEVVRKVDRRGIITTVAGKGGRSFVYGFTGDGGLATNAQLLSPSGLALDLSGNLWIADSDRVRKVTPKGLISTVAGNGSFAYAGDGGQATSASLNGPQGVAMDLEGNLFIADTSNHRIRKVGPTGVITTVAGNGAAGYSGDGGPATRASLDLPAGVGLDPAGNLYIADTANNRVREVFLGGFPSLTLNNVSPANSGNYQVIVTSPFGSVTSVVASLTVVPASSQVASIMMNSPVVAGHSLLLGFTASNSAGASFTLLQTSTLTGPWTINPAAILTTNTPAGAYQFSTPVPSSIEFYQVRSP